MADIDLKAATPDTSLPSTGFLVGADSQSASAPSVYSVQTVATALLGSTSLTGATVTTSSPVLDLAQTWNAAGVTFTGLKFNATNTASGSSSLLMDLQVDSSSRVVISRGTTLAGSANGGQVLLYNSANSSRLSLGFDGNNTPSIYGSGGHLSIRTADFVPQLNVNTVGIHIGSSTGAISFNGGYGASAIGDLILGRRAAASLRLGAADAATAVAQTLGVQSVTGVANTAGANFTIAGSQGTGTGAGGSIVFQVAPAGTAGSAQNALVTALTINSSGHATFSSLVITGNLQLSSNTIQNFASLPLAINALGNNVGIGLSSPSEGLTVRSTYGIAWDNGSGTADTILARDAANTLALRNGAAAQAFRVYNTTDGTNLERGFMRWSSNVLQIGTEKAGTGTARALEFQTDGTTRLTIAANGTITAAGGVIGQAGFTLENTGAFSYGVAARFRLSSPDVGIALLRNASTDDFNRLQFGGTTSSFPALKRSSTTLQARLADDSAFASVQGKLTTETAYTAGAPTATGYLVLYDSNGTAYKVAAEAL